MNLQPPTSSDPTSRSSSRLPISVDQLVGRKRELRRLRRMLENQGVRLLTLVGPPGVGKTRLALEAANQVAQRLVERAYLVDLVPIRDPAHVLPIVARTLGQADEFVPALDWLRRTMQEEPVLLVLDNAEHLLPDAATAIAELLAACPLISALITSREALHIRGERIFLVEPLETPNSTQPFDFAAVKRSLAVSLFVERAREVTPDFALTPTNAPDIAEICVGLNGLPLALELAAARTVVFSPRELLARLKQPFDLLSGGARDLPLRHHTMRAAIAWSYNFLDLEEKTLFRRLSVYSGSFTVDDVTAVCQPGNSTIDQITSLVRKNLLVVAGNQRSPADSDLVHESRFVMLEIIREFALELLMSDAEEFAETRRRHAEYYRDLAEQVAAAIMDPEQIADFDRLELEHDNLIAALRWAIAESQNAELAVRLAHALSWFWYSQGYLNEGWHWLGQVLKHAGEVDPVLQASIHTPLAAIALRRGDFQRAFDHAIESVDLLIDTEARVVLSHTLGLAGQAAIGLDDLDGAERSINEALAIARQIENQWLVAGALWELSQVALRRDNLEHAREQATEARNLWSKLGDKQGTVLAMDVLAASARKAGDLDQSRQLDEASLSMRRGLGDRPGTGVSLRGLAEVARRRSEYVRAQRLYVDSLEITQEIGDLPGLAASFEGLGLITAQRNRQELAATLFGAAEQARMQLNGTSSPVPPDIADRIAEVRDNLAPTVFAQAWNTGRVRPLDETISKFNAQFERSAEVHPRSASTAVHQLAPLSRRERQVAALVAQGLDNMLIAEELKLTRRTVETHVSNILRKLDLTSRVQIALWAIDQGLVSSYEE